MLVGVILLFIVPCIVPSISGNPDTVTLTFYSTDDVHVNKEHPDSPRGTWEYMAIRNTSGWLGDNKFQCDVLVKFGLSSVPSGVTVVSATLNLYYYSWQKNNPAGRDLNLYTVINDWDEDTVTWNTRPTCDTEAISNTTVPSSYGWMEWDITPDVQKYVDGQAINYGWKITDENGWGSWYIPETFFRTKEYGNYIPYLEIEYEADITVSAPSTGDIWYRGETYSITWDSENAGSNVKIQYKIGSYYYTIISSTSNDGSYLWTIPTSLSTSSSYKIKITSTSYGSVYDESGYFSIDKGTITVSSPYSGATWYEGETKTVTWTSEGSGSYVDIKLYKSGSYISTIASSTQNDGSYSWTIPSSLTTSSYYTIRVTSTSYSNVYDESSYFSIDERYIMVNSPYSGNKWYEGEAQTITWSSKNAGNYVKIELYKSGTYVSTIISSTSNDGSYSWTAPSSLTSSSYYKIRITSTSISSVYDESSYFSIDQRSITVKSSNDGETWYHGETYEITWNSENAGNSVKIELYKGGSRVSTITSSTSNDGSYFWTIPSSLTTDSSYKIKITSISNPNVYDYSNTYLTIKETWLQEWLWVIAITALVMIVLIGVGIIARSKSKKKKIFFEMKKKEIKDIIHKVTKEKKKKEQKTVKKGKKPKKKGDN